MSYITVEEYMEFAWLTSIDSTTSTKITMILEATTEIINDLIWDVSYSQKTQQVKYCDVVCQKWHYDTIETNYTQIQSLDSINWTSYTWVLNTDYQITPPLKSRIVIKDLPTYINGLVFDWFDIVFTSWYQTAPADIKYLQYLLTSWESSKQNWSEVKSYTLWPRQVTFADTNSFKSAEFIVSNYNLIYI